MDDSSKLCVLKTSRITIYYVSLTIYKQNDGEGSLKCIDQDSFKSLITYEDTLNTLCRKLVQGRQAKSTLGKSLCYK